MEKDFLYEGNSKVVFATNNPEEVIVYFTDEINAFNGIKKANITSKGVINSQISGYILEYLNKHKVPNYFIKYLDDRKHLCQSVNIIPIQIIIRNIITGSIVKRLNLKDRSMGKTDIYEICYKDDKLGNPLINDSHVLALGICTKVELKTIYKYSKIINESLKSLFNAVDITLVDFKIEFGKTAMGEIILADEITPDSCRFWDTKTGVSLDKDRFRQDLGNVIEGYREILKRLQTYEIK
ncbi:MAG: phosphoribosylaminoimidazolesuccinocarboxamide synthase [Bacilli bacterium]|nr:phosphoribosylaminoimidazolesuccinocarboxamide synthase [Bacilli bacterium]